MSSAHGAIGLDDAMLEKTLTYMRTLPAGGTASLQRDMMAGKRSELHAQIGSMVTYAEAKGVPTPATAFALAALLPQEHTAEAAARAHAKPTAAALGAEGPCAWSMSWAHLLLVAASAAAVGAAGGALLAKRKL